MHQKLIILFVFLSLFLGTPLLNLLGYGHTDESAMIFFKIHPATYISFILFAYISFKYRTKIFLIYLYRKAYFQLLFSIVLVIIYLFVVGRTNSIAFIFDTLIAPTLFVISVPINNKNLRKKLINLLITFFIINCSLAIIERGLDMNFFLPKSISNLSGLRATALQGHPLNNALITVTIMSFLFLSKIKNKYFLLLIGLISLICFGTRGALYGISSLTVFFILYQVIYNYKTSFQALKSSSINKGTLLLFLFLSSIFFYYLLLYTKFGERLTSVSYFDDDSAGSRIDALSIFKSYSLSDLFFGIDQKTVDIALWYIQLPIIENFWIQWILKFGIIFFCILVFFLFKTVYKSIKSYRGLEKIYLFLVFFIVASTNNSLATSTTALSIYMICTSIFSPFRIYEKIKLKKN